MFGGQNSAVLTDSWIYDPGANAWTQLSPAASPPVASSAVFQRLAYDPDDNVFAMVWVGPGGYANGPAQGFTSAQTWFFRYKGSGPNVGTFDLPSAPTAASVNRNADAWAN